ncbi:MAG: hypothetical protein HZC28_01115 [Spirochaetes bacterium]|nr:hypothetical protein [Spirochaetota bacterium]
MRAYLSLLRARMLTLLQYRGAAIAGVITQLFWGLIRMMVFTAFYASGNAGGASMSLPQTVGYVWLGQAFLLLVPWTIDKDLAEQFRSGGIAYELVRPLDLYSLWFVRVLSVRVAPLVMRAVPIILAAALFFGLPPPPSIYALLASVLSFLLAIILSTAVATFVTVTLFWTVDGTGLDNFIASPFMFLSGLVVPLPLFPVWAQQILGVLPFSLIIDVPFRFYLGHLQPEHIGEKLLLQAGWIIILVVFGRVLTSRGLRRTVVQGG